MAHDHGGGSGYVAVCARGSALGHGAELAYLYHADDRVVVRALLDQNSIRVELAPLAAGDTRIVVVSLRDGEVDRRLSSRIVGTVEERLTHAAVP